MKVAQCLKGIFLASGVMFAGAALAEEAADPVAIGEKIYTRTLGRGCGACHDSANNPNLFESVKKLSRDDFKAVLVNGRNNNSMPKVMGAIMSLPAVKGLSEDQAVDALLAYLTKGK